MGVKDPSKVSGTEGVQLCSDSSLNLFLTWSSRDVCLLCLRDNLGKLFSFYRHVIQDTERKGTCIGSVVGDRVPLGWTSGVCQGEQNQALFTPSHSKDKASGQSWALLKQRDKEPTSEFKKTSLSTHAQEEFLRAEKGEAPLHNKWTCTHRSLWWHLS